MTSVMLCKNMEGHQASGTLTMVTSCANNYRCFLICKAFDTANAKKALKETNKRQKSSTTSQIWTTLLLTGKLVKSAHWPTVNTAGSRQHHMGNRSGTTALHRRPTRVKSRCHPSHARACSAMSGPATEFAFPKPSLTWLDKGHSKGSFQDSRMIVHS